MPIYYGKSADGSDMQEFGGFYTDGEVWSNKPFTEEHRLCFRLQDYLDDRGVILDEVYREVIDKRSDLPRRMRDYVLSHYDVDGRWIYPG